MNAMHDGVYDVQVVDAEDRDDGTIDVEVTFTGGPRTGETEWVRITDAELSGFEILGLSGTLRVVAGLATLEL